MAFNPRRNSAAAALAVVLVTCLVCSAVAQCSPGEQPSGSSNCVPCTGNKISPDGGKCVKCPGRSTADDSKTSCICGPGSTDDGNGRCVCLPGYGGGSCKPCTGNKVSTGGTNRGCTSCGPRKAPNSDLTACVCAANVVDDGACDKCLAGYGGNNCKPCSRNKFSDGTSRTCTSCTRGSTSSDGVTCTCNDGSLTWDASSNTCSDNGGGGGGGSGGGSGSTCPTGSIKNNAGVCVCTDTTKEVYNNACVPKCAAGYTRNSSGVCVLTGSGGGGGGGTGTGAFNIQLVRIGTDSSQDATFQAAKAKWESILKVDVPDFVNTANIDLSDNWVSGYSNKQRNVDDIVIMYGMSTLSGDTLGWAGPTYFRNDGSKYSNTPVAAVMMFDKNKITSLGGQDNFKIVVLHEMGHALGLGTVDDRIGCIKNCVAGSKSNNFWQCKNANAKYLSIGCKTQVPIETEMGDGSGCGHWSETKLKTELMTPVLDDGVPNPLSVVTIGALEDIYGDGSVDYGQADAFSCQTNIVASVAATTQPTGYEIKDQTIRPTAYPYDVVAPTEPGTASPAAAVAAAGVTPIDLSAYQKLLQQLEAQKYANNPFVKPGEQIPRPL